MTPRPDTEIRELLTTAIPAPDASSYKDWEAVLARAEAEPAKTPIWRRDLARRGTLVLAAAAAVFAAVMLWPTSASQSVLQRALAAIGDGPIIHVVYQPEPDSAFVDLATGKYTPILGQRDEYLSPSGALRIGAGADHVVFPPGKLSADEQQTDTILLGGYRMALESGQAILSGLESFRGQAVYWAQFKGQSLPDVSDHRNHLWSYEVAIDAKSFKPVYVRHERDNKPVPITGETILLLETLPAGSVDFTPTPKEKPRIEVEGGTTYSQPRDLLSQIGTDEGARALGATPLWLGPSYQGKPLSYLSAGDVFWGSPDSPTTSPAIELCYGEKIVTVTGRFREKVTYTATSCGKPGDGSVFLEEATSPTENFRWPVGPTGKLGLDVPSGSALVYLGAPEAMVVIDGVYVHIDAATQQDALAAARALQPLGSS